MDSEKFDKVMLDLLYDELDELTRAAALRHMESSARARHTYSELRATREVGSVPLVDPPADLTDRILEAERVARADRSLYSRLGSAVSILAGYAMRPQLAMAALLMLMIGSSLIFLRARPGQHDRVLVTERGVPESENESVALIPTDKRLGSDSKGEAQAHGVLRSAEEEPEPAAAAGPSERPSERATSRQAGRAAPGSEQGPGDDDAFGVGSGVGNVASGAAPEKKAKDEDGESSAGTPFSNAMLAYREGRFAEARERFDEVASSGDPNAATASLFAARATERSTGCAEAARRYESVADRYAGAPVAQEARWAAAECHRKVGNLARARSEYSGLLASADYAEKARRALTELEEREEAVAARARASKAAPPADSKPAKPAAPAAPAASETP